ncbi:hypothetical protein ACEQPO_01285 [Bacillus sp. SL00103]
MPIRTILISPSTVYVKHHRVTEQENERGIPIVLLAESKPEHTDFILHVNRNDPLAKLVKESSLNSGYEENKADELASLLHSMVIGGLSMTTALKQTTPLEHVKCTLDTYLRDE